MIQERTIQARPGIPVLLLGLPALLAVAILFFVGAANFQDGAGVAMAIFGLITLVVMAAMAYTEESLTKFHFRGGTTISIEVPK